MNKYNNEQSITTNKTSPVESFVTLRLIIILYLFETLLKLNTSPL